MQRNKLILVEDGVHDVCKYMIHKQLTSKVSTWTHEAEFTMLKIDAVIMLLYSWCFDVGYIYFIVHVYG